MWPENWPALMLFLDMETQWRVMEGMLVGLRYDAAETVMRIRKLRNRSALLSDLQTMERAAMKAANKAK